MNCTLSFTVAVVVGLLAPASALPDATSHSGLFGGVTYGRFTYQGLGDTEAAWGPMFGAFAELAAFPSDMLLLTIEGSYLRIGSGSDQYYPDDQIAPPPPQQDGASNTRLQPAPLADVRESRTYVSIASFLKVTTTKRITPYLQLGPTLNIRLPDGTHHSNTLALGGACAVGISAVHGRQAFMAELRYMQAWSSSESDDIPASRAQALVLAGKIGY